jgi:hypothetical protein
MRPLHVSLGISSGLTAALAIALVTLAVLRTAPQAKASSRIVAPAAATQDDLPGIEVISSDEAGVDLLFDLPVLAMEEFTLSGTRFSSVAIPGGALEGEVGAPGIPSFTRLVAIPDNAAVTVTTLSEDVQELPGITLMPIQAEEGSSDAGEFAFNPSAYTQVGYGASPLTAAGAPALCGNLRVVPLTFRPVQFDPAGQTLRVSSRLRVQIRFAGHDPVNARNAHSDIIPTSFDQIYRRLVVNYQGPQQGQRVANGTWLLICPNDAFVINKLQPLMTWRQRKGMAVRLATLAETGGTADQVKAYIQNAYDTWPIPPEYIVLAGDAEGSYNVPTWFENLSGMNGEGDYPYTLLAGSDELPDAHIGRLSFNTTTELDVIVAKIVNYESNPYVQDFTWFQRACLVGDPNGSGYSTVQVMQWIKTRLRQLGYTQIDTVFSGTFVTQMSTALSRGDSYFAYRGFGGMSGWTNTNTYNLTNGWKLSFGVVSTCGTGSFANGTSINEGFLRAGTLTNPKGSVGCSATATNGTHTRFNNCFVLGVSQGLLYEGLYNMGAAITRGRLELFLEYGQSGQGVYARIFSHWNNLMGDPAAECWTGFPANSSVSHPSSLPLGSNSMAVVVSNGGWPVEGAQVCCWKGSETFVVGTTDAAGQCQLALNNATAGDLLLTVTKHDRAPYKATIPVAAQPLFVGYQASAVDDDDSGESQGNGDGLINPGEAIELRLQLKNYGSQNVNGITATITSSDPYLLVSDGEESFGNIAPGASAWTADDFGFQVAPTCPHGRVLRFNLDATDGTTHWMSLVDLSVVSADLVAAGTTLYGSGDGILDPGESVGLSVALHNNGGAAAIGAAGVLRSLSPWVQVSDSLGVFSDIPIGGQGENVLDQFSLSASPEAYPGHLALFSLMTHFSGGVTDTTIVSLTVGQKNSTDPIGPDGYGYYAFDNTDTSYPSAPVYSWIEIDPTWGGNGTQVSLGDYGDYQDKSLTVTLPFAFTFYGRSFTQATICSNGWLAFGSTYLTDYRNWTIPGAGAPSNLLAVFWDDLQEVSPGGHVFQKYDAANHRYIVEWSRMINVIGSSPETFEVILYDAAYHPTVTGDGMVDFQYFEVNNVDDTDGYATTGIENAEHTDGLLYTYFNLYPQGAAPLAAGRAIRFLPVIPQPQGTLAGTVLNASHGDDPMEGATIRLLETGRTFISGPDGHYGGGVSGGTYTVTAAHDGFAPDTVRHVVVVPSQATALDFHLIDVGGPTISGVTQVGPATHDLGPYQIDALINDPSVVAAAGVFYRINGTGWGEVAMTHTGGDHYTGQIPVATEGWRIDYYVWARDGLGHASVAPGGAPGTFYTFYVTESVYSSNCEDPGDPAWQLGVSGDLATTGLWIRDDPVGTEYTGTVMQPEDDHTPDPAVKCFVTGNANPGEAAGINDVDGGCTTLQSPVIDLSHAEMGFVSYWRWYGEGGNSIDDEFAVDVSSDGGANWIPLERVPEVANSWTQVVVDLTTLITLTNQIVFRFMACDLNTAGLVEAAIDDICIDAFIPNYTGTSEPAVAPVFRFDRVRPNPFSGSADICFSLARTSETRLALYDVQGRLVRTLLQGIQTAGPHAVAWDGRDNRGATVCSGIYFVQLEGKDGKDVRKLIRLE